MSGRNLLHAAWAAVLLSIFTVCGEARAQWPGAEIVGSADKRVALVIGNANYVVGPKLTKAADSANAVAQMFRGAGFKPVDIVLDADHAAFERALLDFRRAAAGASVAAIYYAGHGIGIGDANFLVPVDAHLASDLDVGSEAIALQRLVSLVAGSKRFGLVMLDACHDDAFAGSMRREAKGVGRVSAGVTPAEPSFAHNLLVAFATGKDKTCEEGGGPLSPFATALVKNLPVPGLDIRFAFGRIRNDVLLATDRRQEPFVSGALDGHLIALVPPEPGQKGEIPPEAIDGIESDYELVERIGTRRAFEMFIQSYGRGPYVERARQRLKALDEQQAR